MTNVSQVKRKAIKVVLGDGIEREIKFTLNTMAELEDKYGTVDTAFKALESGSIKAVRYMLWAAMQHETKPLTEKQVGDLIDVQSIGSLMSSIEAATKEDMPEVSNEVAPSNPN